MKKFLIFSSVLLLSGGAFGQSLVKADQLSSEWTLLGSNEQVNFEISRSECQISTVSKPFDYAFVKITNKTNSEVQVNFQLGSWFNGECVDCETTAETVRSITLKPNSAQIGDCTFANGQLSVLIKNPLIPTSDVTFDGIQLLNLNTK
jgi:uncharacterized protein YcfL